LINAEGVGRSSSGVGRPAAQPVLAVADYPETSPPRLLRDPGIPLAQGRLGSSDAAHAAAEEESDA